MNSEYPWMRALLSLMILLFGFHSETARAQVHPAKSWKTLSLQHFELIYDAENQQLAEIYAARLQALEPTLRNYWQIFPKKTVVVLNDRTDLTNGYATFLPYPLVMIFPVLPGPMDSIGEYNDWAWEIMVHEYTHILEFEQTRGAATGLSYIFGSIVRPNALLPRWWLEGAAVEAETRFSNAGRLRSKMQAGTLRALEKAEKLQDVRLAEINEFNIPTWPYGARPYLYGSLLFSDWVTEKKEAATRDLHLLTGGRLPYFLDGALEPIFGKGQVELFDDTRHNMLAATRKELADLSKVPFTESKLVDPEMVESLSPAISPDSLKLAYIGKNDILRRRVQVLIRPSKDVAFDPSHRMEWFGREFDQNLPSSSPLPQLQHDAPPGGNITRVSWHPDSRSFVFDQVSEKNRFQETSDLWIFDLATGKAVKITDFERAREPAFSPDGQNIAFVRVSAGKTSLAIFNTAEKKSRDLYSSHLGSRVSFPSWLDKDTLIFSARENDKEQLLKLRLADNSFEAILPTYPNPQFVSVEKDRILFTSAVSGVRNLYAVGLDFKDIRPVTHSASHIMSASYDEAGKTYYFTEISDKGLQLRSMNESERVTQALPTLTPHWVSRYESSKAPEITSTGKLTETAEDYSPWFYLLPRYWLPFVSWDDRGTYVTAQTGGSDPLGKHTYALSASYDSYIKRTNGIFRYVNQSFYPQLSLTAYDYSIQLANQGEYSRTALVQGSAAWEIASVSPDWFVGLGASSTERERFNRKSVRVAPFITTFYGNSNQTAAQITPEKGWLGSAQLSAPQDRDLGKTFYVGELSGTAFWSKWLPARHALMLKAQGRYSDEPLLVQNMEQSVSIQTTTLTPMPLYLNRGYPSGAFLGKSIFSTSLEYRFPLSRIDFGPAGVPFYIHRVHAAVVADGTYFDGAVYDFRKNQQGYRWSEWGQGYWSVGGELKYDLNLGYSIPLTVGAGLYWPLRVDTVESGPRLGISLIM